MARKSRTQNTSETTQDKFWDKEIPVKVIQKSNAIQVRVKYVEKKQEEDEDGEEKVLRGLDIREFYKRKDDPDYKPSAKGTVIPLEHLYDLYTAIGDFVLEHIVPQQSEEETPKKKKSISKRKKASGE